MTLYPPPTDFTREPNLQKIYNTSPSFTSPTFTSPTLCTGGREHCTHSIPSSSVPKLYFLFLSAIRWWPQSYHSSLSSYCRHYPRTVALLPWRPTAHCGTLCPLVFSPAPPISSYPSAEYRSPHTRRHPPHRRNCVGGPVPQCSGRGTLVSVDIDEVGVRGRLPRLLGCRAGV